METHQVNVVAASTFPCQAIVLYDFEATNEDEMTVRKDEKIFIESKPEYEGWLIAKGRDRSGLVPEAYVQLTLPIVVPLEHGLSSFLLSHLSFYFCINRNSEKYWS
jgi:hypothetical protein